MPPDADEGLCEMFETVGRRGFAYAWQILHNRDDALDAVQAAMAATWAARRLLRADRDPRGWFYRTLRNKCLDLLRRRRTQQTAERDGRLAAPDPVARAAPGLEGEEDLVRLRRALDALPADAREIILLRDYHDLSYADIADVLKIPAGTVMSRLHRARAALRAQLGEGGQP